jgi:ribulose 1,5-bisphosphate synthetase/thiazole synthase
MPLDPSVLIVGGGLNGLTCAVLVADQAVARSRLLDVLARPSIRVNIATRAGKVFGGNFVIAKVSDHVVLASDALRWWNQNSQAPRAMKAATNTMTTTSAISM